MAFITPLGPLARVELRRMWGVGCGGLAEMRRLHQAESADKGDR
jgi:hypothetical protein